MALLDHVERAERAAAARGEAAATNDLLCPKGALIAAAGALCDDQAFRPVGDHVAAAADGAAGGCRCAAFQQMVTLCTDRYVKARDRKKLCATGVAYELLPDGRAAAERLRARGEGAGAAPLRSHARVGAAERGVVLLLVDEREGGGQRHAKFTQLCDALAREGARFETRRLPTGRGDYQYVRADGGAAPKEAALPLLIERKSAVDVAASLKDGRWERQQAAMAAENRASFGGAATVAYLLEGDTDAEAHSCSRCNAVGDGRGVGGCGLAGFPTLAKVRRAIDQLTADGHEVVRTESIAATARHRAARQRELQRGERPAPAAAAAAPPPPPPPGRRARRRRRPPGRRPPPRRGRARRSSRARRRRWRRPLCVGKAPRRRRRRPRGGR